MTKKSKVQNSQKKRGLTKAAKLKVWIFVGIVVILVAAAYQQQNMRLATTPVVTITQGQNTKMYDNLTSDEKFILNPPAPDASRSALKKHAQTVAKLAKLGNTLEINNCQPNPLVLQVKQGAEFTIKNRDGVKHKILFDEEHSLELPGQNSLTIKAQFKYGTGDYGYVCQGVGIVGFLHVTS